MTPLIRLVSDPVAIRTEQVSINLAERSGLKDVIDSIIRVYLPEFEDDECTPGG